MKAMHRLGMGLLAGATLFAVGAVFHVSTPWLVPSIPIAYRDHPGVFRPWTGWTRIYMMLHPFGYGLIFAWVFGVVHDASKDGRIHTAGGAAYGFLVFLVGCLPVYLLNYASFPVPGVILVSWMARAWRSMSPPVRCSGT